MGFRTACVLVCLFLAFTASAYVAKELKQGSRPKIQQLTPEQREKVQELWEKYGPDYSAYGQKAEEYPCGPLPHSPSVPTSVHKLRPGDVKVVGAMGDSLTAGTGIEATTIFGVLIQNRGLSWSGGGETTFEEQITMPNILKKYNPEVYGFATGDGDEDSARSMFNVAVGGSTSSELVDQAQELILRMRNDPNVDFENDWKVVTILSGNNDLCDFCNQRDDINVEEFYEHVTAALDILHAQLPRTLVNLVEPLNMEIVTELNKGLLCSSLHYMLCDCAAYPGSEQAEVALVLEADLYQTAIDDIAMSGRYDTREDFTVVVQPFFNRTYIPRLENGEPDMSYFAPDCFHLSRKGQAAAASALWNNMIEPIQKKRTEWAPGEAIECPTEAQPYFFTNKNSDSHHRADTFQQQSAADKETSQALTFQHESPQKPEHETHASVVGAVAGVGAAVVAVAAIIILIIRRNRRRAYQTMMVYQHIGKPFALHINRAFHKRVIPDGCLRKISLRRRGPEMRESM